MASSIVLSDNGVTSGSAGIKSTGGNDGVLLLQTTTASGTATTAVLIDNAQNVGVGVTPNAWNSIFKSLDVGATASFVGSSGGANVFNNAYYNGTDYIYKTTAAATRYLQSSGAHQWFNAPSGTAGNAITFTQAMTLDASGNLLVGTTSNIVNGNARVQVVGTAGIRAQSTTSGETSVGAFATSTGATYYYIGYDMTAGAIKYQVLFNGNVQNTNNSYGAISDVKLKENIVDASPKLANLMQVKVRNYNLIGDTTKQIGVVAQELETVFPSMIEETADYEDVPTTDANGNETTERVATGTKTKAVKYSVFVPMLIKAIQEQQALIQSLTDRLTALEGAAK